MAKRAIYTLECLKQFRLWNSDVSHSLGGKIDLTRVMLVGHSTSGRDIGLASYINTLDSVQGLPPEQGADYPWVELNNGEHNVGPYHFGIKAILSIEPSSPSTYLHELPYGYHFSTDTVFRTRWQHDTANRVDPHKPYE